jgi:hypothetical protein
MEIYPEDARRLAFFDMATRKSRQSCDFPAFMLKCCGVPFIVVGLNRVRSSLVVDRVYIAIKFCSL